MISHQTERVHFDAKAFFELSDAVEEQLAVTIVPKDDPSTGPTIHDVVPTAWCVDSALSSHADPSSRRGTSEFAS